MSSLRGISCFSVLCLSLLGQISSEARRRHARATARAARLCQERDEPAPDRRETRARRRAVGEPPFFLPPRRRC